MTIVVDANVAVKWFVEQKGSDHARRVQAYEGSLIAPAALIMEVTNALWKTVTFSTLGSEQALAAVRGLSRWFAELVDDRDLAQHALRLAIEVKHPSYDCAYVVLAERRGALLVTADNRLVRRLAGTSYSRHVIALPDWSGTE